MVKNNAEEARVIIEQKDPEKLTGEEHIALAVYTLADVLVAFLESMVDGEEEEEEEEEDEE